MYESIRGIPPRCDSLSTDISKLVENYGDILTPQKVRRIQLLDAIGFPMPFTRIYNACDVAKLKEDTIESLAVRNRPHIIRVARNPDKFSMPVFVIEEALKTDDLIKQLTDLLNVDRNITHLILREYITTTEANSKISGRFLIDRRNMQSLEEVLEIYKGSRSIGILNNVDVNEVNFYGMSRNAGNMFRPIRPLSPESLLKESEIREIYSQLTLYKDKVDELMAVKCVASDKANEQQLLVLEFSYTNGRMAFTDFD